VKDEHDAADAAILVAHRRYLDAAIDLLRLVATTGIDSPSRFVLMALAIRLVQRGTAAHTLCVQGYGADADPILRSMLSALASTIHVTAANSDGRALAYMADETRIARNRLPRLREHGLLTAAEAARLLDESVTFDAERREHYALMGISAEAHSGRGRAWHGHPTDEQFFAALGLTAWYDTFYASMSEDSHATAWSVVGEMKALARGETTFGPRYEATRFVVSASYAFITRCVRELDRYFDLKREPSIAAASEAMRLTLTRTLPASRSSG
jgi:hypothetical protein